jgi:uncharacterized protein (TIGR02231 family)
MLRRILSTTNLFLLLPALLQTSEWNLPSQSDRTLKSRIASVTVYRDRALITRSAQEQLPVGSSTLVVGNLPVSLIDQSVRVGGEAEGRAKITDVKVATIFLDTIPEQRIRQLQERLKALRLEQQGLMDKLQVLRSQKDFVDSLRISSARGIVAPGQRAAPEEWERMLSFVERRLTALYAEIRTTNVAVEEVKNKIEAVEREINQSRAYSRKSQKQIVISINAERSGAMRLELSYVLMGAGWSPHYEARVLSESKTLQLAYAAHVRQATNEDWNDIDLTLSTALPAAGGTAPELQPWFVDIMRPLPPRPMALQRQELMGVPSTADAERRAEAQPMEMEVAEVQPQMTAVAFKILSRVTIPSDNNPHRVTIAIENIPVDLIYRAVPKYSPFAFLTASGKNTTEYPFLSGPMNIFFENSFVANSTLAQVLSGQEFEMGLGVDEGVRVERKLVNRFTEYTGTFSKKTKYIYDIVIKLENARGTKVDLVLNDQIPISRNEKIVVEQIEPPAKSMPPDATGKLTWNLSLNPREKREIKLKFSIEHPSDLNVVGLE